MAHLMDSRIPFIKKNIRSEKQTVLVGKILVEWLKTLFLFTCHNGPRIGNGTLYCDNCPHSESPNDFRVLLILPQFAEGKVGNGVLSNKVIVYFLLLGRR